jgi:hypothetical protein
MGHKRTFRTAIVMSALPPKADIDWRQMNVRFGSKADITASPRDVRFTSKADIEAMRTDVRFVPEADIPFC